MKRPFRGLGCAMERASLGFAMKRPFRGRDGGGVASLGFAIKRPFRGLAGGLSGALPVRAARAARGRSARLAAPGAPPGLRPGWREPTRSTAEPTAARAENRAQPRRARGCRLGASFGKAPRLRGAETAGVLGLRGDRRSARIVRRPPERTDCAETSGAHGLCGDLRSARRGPRAASARSAGAAWGNAVDLVVSADRPRMGPAATEGPQAGEPKAPRQGPEAERIRQPSPREALAFCFPPSEGERIRQPFPKGGACVPLSSTRGRKNPATIRQGRARLRRALAPIFLFTRARPVCYPSPCHPARRGSGRCAPEATRKYP